MREIISRSKVILSGSVRNFSFECRELDGEVLHLIKTIGPIGFDDRAELYRNTLTVNQSDKLFSILDNSDRYDNDFSLDDMRRLSEVLDRHGITTLYAATVTYDEAYSTVIDLANLNARAHGLKGEVISTNRLSKAEDFILSMLAREKRLASEPVSESVLYVSGATSF